MNQTEIEELKQKIIKCDKIIHMQQLGVVWEPHNQPENVEVQNTEGNNESNKDGKEDADAIGQSKNESNIRPADDANTSKHAIEVCILHD